MPRDEDQVSLQIAYEAARDRALRTTEALILAEAQVVRWKTECAQLETRLGDAEAEVRLLRWRNGGREGGGDDAEGEDGGAEVQREADTPYPFSD